MEKGKKLKTFNADPIMEEEIGVNIMDNIVFETEKDTIKKGKIQAPKVPQRKFVAFLDGTMKLYKVAYVAFTGTPIYTATVSTALVYRNEEKKLDLTPYSKTLNLLLFPLKSYFSCLKELSKNQISEDQLKAIKEDFDALFRRLAYLAKKQKSNFLKEQTLQQKAFNSGKSTGEILFERSNTWFFCDTSYPGIVQHMNKSSETIKKALVPPKDLFNPQRIKEVARARARYIMGLLEFYSAMKFLKENDIEGFLMIDGLFYPYKRVHSIFNLTLDEYKQLTKNVVGFIKHPRTIPADVVKEALFLNEGYYLTWIGHPSEAEEEEHRIKEFDVSMQKYGFAILRFRKNPFIHIPSPIGLVKLQTDPEEDMYQVIEAVLYEQYPLPSDRRRLYNETYPIEVAEKIAKANLSSEERVKGLIRSLF